MFSRFSKNICISLLALFATFYNIMWQLYGCFLIVILNVISGLHSKFNDVTTTEVKQKIITLVSII
jgi:hypothetical protein